jgi:hypothetical protein
MSSSFAFEPNENGRRFRNYSLDGMWSRQAASRVAAFPDNALREPPRVAEQGNVARSATQWESCN